MADLGYATLPRGMHIPHNHHSGSSGHLSNGHLPNGHVGNSNNNSTCHGPPHVTVVSAIPNGSSTIGNGSAGGRSIHDGFATIRAGGNKKGRARSSSSVNAGDKNASNNNNQCHHGCCSNPGRTWAMEPLWEEKGSLSLDPSGVPQVTRRERQQLPWWEIATRRSRYRSCPAFSQASFVNALEQTMSNVTSRLERLASSPDLKENEAAELRKTAAVLRQQSSAVCQSVSSGYLSMERQLSCDSVSSVTSSVSGASLNSYASMISRSAPNTLPHHFNHNKCHQQGEMFSSSDNTKVKKRSWLRSSFRRAFGRPGRKRSKQNIDANPQETGELPMHHTVNSAVKNLSAPPPPPPSYCSAVKTQHPAFPSPQKDIPKQTCTLRKKDKRCSVDENDLVTRLQQELAQKERELTDCRLEVLSAQHQLQTQADTIAKFQTEVVGLKEENNKLLTLLRGQSSPGTDAHITPLTQTLNSLTLTPGNAPGNNVSVVNGRQVKVMVVEQPNLTSLANANVTNISPSCLTHIGNVNVESKTTWEEFDKLIANTVKDYGNRIDPVSALGLDSDSIFCYRVDDVPRSSELALPELLPYGYCVGNVDALHIWLKGGNNKVNGEMIGNASLAAFTSATPASTLKLLAGQLTEHRRLVIAGLPASGKSFLAQTLAQFYVINSGRELTEDAIKTFKVTSNNTTELCQMLSSMWPRGGLGSSIYSTSSVSSNMSASSSSSSSSSVSSNSTNPDSEVTPPAIIIIDDLHAASGLVETLQRCLPTSIHIGPAIIATSCSTASLATRLHINCNFKWASLTPQQEPVRGLLGRVLRRRVVAAEVAVNTRLPDAHHLAEWLTRLWLHLNTLLSGHCSSNEVGIGPGMLIDCPLGQEETQVWFTEVWNNRLVPYIKETIRNNSSISAVLETWTDPLDWVLATYPWPVNAACGPDQLTRITASDISQNEGTLVTRKITPPSDVYNRFSARNQQIRKTAESIYSTPQVLPVGPVIRPGGAVHGTGQTVSTNIIKAPNPNQTNNLIVNGNNNISSGNVINSLSNVNNNVNNGQNIYSIPIINKQPVFNGTVRKGNDNDDCKMDTEMSTNDILSGKNNICTEEKNIRNLGDNNNLPKVPLVITQNGHCDPKSQDMTDEDMDSDSASSSSKEDENLPYMFNDYNSTTETKIMPMDMEFKSEKYNSNQKNLEILAKNAINSSNGIGTECVKIIRDSGTKMDIRDISHELTSTFKPSETAM